MLSTMSFKKGSPTHRGIHFAILSGKKGSCVYSTLRWAGGGVLYNIGWYCIPEKKFLAAFGGQGGGYKTGPRGGGTFSVPRGGGASLLIPIPLPMYAPIPPTDSASTP